MGFVLALGLGCGDAADAGDGADVGGTPEDVADPWGTEGGFALVYDGPVAAPGGPEAMAAVAAAAGLEVEYIDDLSTLPERLQGAAAFLIGGTEDDLSPILSAFTTEVAAAFEDYLNEGGRYLGVCGGGYSGSTGWEDVNGFVSALALVDAESEAYIEESDPMIITVTWEGEERPIYYAYGPAFLPAEGAAVQVLATYDDGRIAALLAPHGKGKVALCGPHPEADESWLDDDPVPQNAAAWEPTADLAASLLEQLLSDDPIATGD